VGRSGKRGATVEDAAIVSEEAGAGPIAAGVVTEGMEVMGVEEACAADFVSQGFGRGGSEDMRDCAWQV
jgi:hypothetical protein